MFNRLQKLNEGLRKTREAWFSRAINLFGRVDEELWEALGELLISADVGVKTTQMLLDRVRSRVRSEGLRDGEAIRRALEEEIARVVTRNGSSAAEPSSPHQPLIILVVGVNGVGKTTSIAKLASLYRRAGKKALLAAADTFRAAAIDQLKVWADRVPAEVVAHQPGAEPGAVVYDALQASASRGIDVTIIDTAGRLHTKTNLMDELSKIMRVITKFDPTAPHEVLLVIDATTGQNGLVQAKQFKELTGVTGLILTKLDGTAKGGIAIAVAHETGIPIKYVSTGEGLDDLIEFDPMDYARGLFESTA